jgi:RecB family endonuclease NucS
MRKADGCIAIHADGGAYKPLNWMNAPNTVVEHDDKWVVTNPKGEIYIGLTRRKRIKFRFSEHKKQFQFRNGLFPLLHASMNKFGYDNHTIEVIHQSEGSKYEGRILETEFILLYKSKGISLNVQN